MMKFIEDMTSPVNALRIIAGVSFFALAAALFAEAVLGLEPCMLCMYQRAPFALGLLLSVAGLAIKKFRLPALALSGIGFLINSGIALYHSGVERHWWASAVEGCSVPDLGNDPKTMLENIMSAPTGNCSEIPWADPILGLSMANYNVPLCLGLAALALYSFWENKKS